MSLRAVPYNRVETSGSILFATRGGKIHSFDLSDGKHVSSWQHPDVEKLGSSVGVDAGADRTTEPEHEHEQGLQSDNTRGAEDDEPPAKRPRVGEEDATAAPPIAAGDQAKRKGKKRQRNGDGSHGDSSRMGRVVDRPLITLMTCTDDGHHLVAVSGHDKAVWVLEHDGQGHLAPLSQRVMPKRPSAIALGFGPHILVADKFGDVYHIPLLMAPAPPAPLAPPRAAPAPAPALKLNEPAANTSTVHSKRNRQALEHQRKQLESDKSKGPAPQPEGPGFELSLLLGHVSMLTALVVAESKGRRYILTGDRDEHIRVSRYMPQAHVIETFCLGHKDFISDMIVPKARHDVLISGGGDQDLFIWDWEAGQVLSKTNLLALAREVVPQTSTVSVCGLTSLLYPAEEGPLTYVLAICEDLKAIFTWQLTDKNQLKNPSIIQLPYNPLHVATVAPANGSPLKLIVATDPGQSVEARSLREYTITRTDGRLSSLAELPIHGQDLDGAEIQVSEKEIRNMFYTAGNLRKQEYQDTGPESLAEGDAVDGVAVSEEQ
ncbi:uncharacterized protein UV8b_03967 [Ustilaginoidea virens]|uniref:Transfer RNA methyltransferase 82 n=1 Tax=Ustilaginoidea virens TaxID=1159556 RepID=A0A8E5MHA0_USTVR|nr:uncharacterized protein UV8b_03967 [Ustilaginoidea virens]QUC19726.1 hypothetical protein UV8b_03967 [Ustilaginoidea virens]